MALEIRIDSLEDGKVGALLQEHLLDMYATSPAESVHALQVDALKAPDLTFFSAWRDGELMGCVAIRELTPGHAELKSMRTASHARNTGVASGLLEHVLKVSGVRGYQTLSLETGSQDFFKPARSLYEKYGFRYTGPFADYREDPNSMFMQRQL